MRKHSHPGRGGGMTALAHPHDIPFAFKYMGLAQPSGRLIENAM
ncbi:hypothetical protein [Luteibacter aegosomatis]|nr:hypothetical protein [Luteibacter aegosomatis]